MTAPVANRPVCRLPAGKAFRKVQGQGGRAAGFTLLEILLAMVLLAFVMLGVWGAMDGATRITHATNAVMSTSENVRTVQQFLRRFVADAGMQPWTIRDGAPTRMFEGSATSMRYVAPLPMQSGHAGLYLQTLTLEKTGAGGMALWLAYQPYARGPVPDAVPVRRELLAGLRGGHFQYLAAAAFGAPGAWRDDWNTLGGLPLAVRIHLDPAWRPRVQIPDMLIRVHTGEGVGAQTGGDP